MPQTSAPLVGENLSDADWRDLGLGESGVVGDYDGSSYALSLPATGDVVTIGSSTQRSVAHVANFVHRIPEDETDTVTIPAPIGSARTDIIVLRYDPTHVGDPGPVRLAVVAGSSAGLPIYDDAPPGPEDLPLWAITRQPGEALSAAVKKQLFPRLAPVLDVPTGANLPLTAPLGTVARQGSNTFRRILNSGNVPSWSQDQYVQAVAPSTAADGSIWFQVT